ncbi:MAG: imidazole glycerol phosphate synthase subunit HisH [Acidimicrobiales bacterium]
MIAVLDYGIGNLRSAERALTVAGGDAELVADPARAAAADGVVLPGVAAFGSAARALRESGLEEVVTSAIGSGKPFLGICVGLQLLYSRSEEDPGVPGLGVIDAPVVSIAGTVKRPQMQWNRLELQRSSRLLAGTGEAPWFYFVHSYFPAPTPEMVATADYGGPVTAAIERGMVFGTQFHPEKSGAAGLRLLANFVEICRQAAGGEPGRRPSAVVGEAG